MIYLLYGPDTYRSRKKLNELVTGYQEKFGTNFTTHRFDADGGAPAAFESFLGGASLFSSKKLVVAYHVCGNISSYEILKKYALSLSRANHTTVFLWEPGAVADLQKNLKELTPFLAKSEEFKLLSAPESRKFVRNEAQKSGVLLTPADEAHLASFGSDLWAASHELEKIALTPSPSGADRAVSAAAPPTIFDVGDSFFLFSGNPLRRLLEFFSSGQDDFSAFSYLAGHARTLFTVKSDLEKYGKVSAKHGLHPFVVKKASYTVRSVPIRTIRAALFRFFEEDRKIKTGESSPRDSLVSMLVERQKD